MKSVLARLARRLSAINADESCITITPEFSEHFLKVYEAGKSSFTGSRMNSIMLVLPYILRDLVAQERRKINAAINSAYVGDPLYGHPLVEDPCEPCIEALLVFMHWYLLIRNRELTVTELVECHRRGKNMREKLKETFPKKSGEESGWKFGKFHAVEHSVVTIIFWGWIETTSCQSGERGHKELLKCLAGIHNNRQVFRQFLSYWERAEQLSRAQNDFEEDEINQVCEEETREEAMHSCELGVRCPLFFMAANRHDQHFRAVDCVGVGPDRRYKVRQSICGRQAFCVWAMTPGSVRMHKVKNISHVPDVMKSMLI